MSPSLFDDTKLLSPSRMSPESSLVTVTVVVSVVVVVVTVWPSASYSIDSVSVITIVSSTPGVQTPVAVTGHSALREEGHDTRVHNHSGNNKLRQFSPIAYSFSFFLFFNICLYFSHNNTAIWH